VPDSFEVDPNVPAGDASAGDTGVTIIVCSACRFRDGPAIEPRPGHELGRATEAAAAGTGITVKRVACLGNCRRGISAAMLRSGCWSYLFGELTPESAGDLIKGARLFATSKDGFMPFRERPESLKRGLIARIPSAINLEELP
jgi:predicted metal-binding protein